LLLSFACDDKKAGKSEITDAGTSYGGDSGRPPGRDASLSGLDGGSMGSRDAGMDGGVGSGDGGVVQKDGTHVVSVAPDYAVAGESYKYEPKTNEPGQSTWTVKSGPSGMTSDGTSIAWEPTKGQTGETKVTLETKVKGEPVQQTATVTVASSEKRAETKNAASEGGTAVVTAPNSKIQGASITVNKGATTSAQPVTVAELGSSPKMAGKRGDSQAVQFGPSGMVFATPALVALPLPSDVVLDPSRLGAFVYDKGHWERVPVVRTDLENRLIYARALHFSPYMGAMSALGLDLTLERAATGSGCEGALFANSVLGATLPEVDASAINNPSEALSAAIEDGLGDLQSIITADGMRGSLRFVRVTELVQGTGEQERVLEQNVLASTLFLPGDGSAVVTHSDALGNVLGVFSFASASQRVLDIAEHLRGAATRPMFQSNVTGELSVAGRLYIVYYEGDASRDPVNVADLGGAAVDQQPTEPLEPESDATQQDIDCDQLAGRFDQVDDRFATALLGEPSGVIATVVGASVPLAAYLQNAPANTPVDWEVFGGQANLVASDSDPNVRVFTASAAGRYQVEARARVTGVDYVQVFVLDVASARTLPSCTPATTQATLTLGESVSLKGVLGESSVARAALTIQWGVLRDGVFQDGPELTADGEHATFKPLTEGKQVVACRVSDGKSLGALGTSELSVLPQGANRLPIDLSIAPQSLSLLVGESVTLKAMGVDPDGDSLHFTWAASGGTLGSQNDSELSSTVSFSSQNPGRFEIDVSIEDGAHLPQLLTASVLVIAQASDLKGTDADGDGWPSGVDCNDNNKAIHPGATDLCGDEVDDDCSGSPRTSDCDRDGQTSEQGDCNDANPNMNSAAVERCDSVDNDCDGTTDEGFGAGAACSSGTGACNSKGTMVCTADGANVVCSAQAGKPGQELCDGVDNDCDGATDEDYVAKATSCGRGQCAATGVLSCVDGREVDSCKPGSPAQSDATCNTLDDDCDGTADEDFVSTQTSCGLGACGATGSTSCVGGQVKDSCKPGAPGASDADCNGVDDDCSGQADEDYVQTQTTCGIGACQAQGTRSCENGKEIDSCVMRPAAESDSDCDGVDDDCSGQADEDYVPAQTTCGIGACEAQGTRSCENGKEVDSCVVGMAAASDNDCDGVDDDCSGQADEDYVPKQTQCGTGACAREGVKSCVSGSEQDSCKSGVPAASDASCDGIDQDCDGVADDDFVKLLEVCNDRDDDCNDSIDEVPCSGVEPGACVPQGAEVCSGVDEDCDGFVDEDDVCGLVLSQGTLPGAWWSCEDASCTSLRSKGFMFGPSGLFLALRSFDDLPYDPAEGPYCRDGFASWALVSGTLTLDWEEGGEAKHAEGTVTFSGIQATIEWSIWPSDDGEPVTFLKRVPEQPGGECEEGPSCQSFEDCHNGFDDDCNGKVDGEDPSCQCNPEEMGPEVCDGRDNDCNGFIDDLRTSCGAPALGVCAGGHLVCSQGGGTECAPGEPDVQGEVCPDGLDNDCDGEVDEPGCTLLSAGETCMNPIDVSAGGVFEAELGARNDVPGLCRPNEYADRVFVFTVPQGPGFEYTIGLNTQVPADVGGMLVALPPGWTPQAGCPNLSGGQGACVGVGGNGFKQYLSGGTTYMLVVESQPEFAGDDSLTLSIAYRNDGLCFPSDQDGDGVSICDSDCDDTQAALHPGAEELCNGRDDDCDMQVDEQEGTCATALTGVCGLGLPSCEAGGSCLPIQRSSVDYCNDGADNDCNGAVDDACVNKPGEACTNAVDLGLGGTFFGTLDNASDDALSRCGSAPNGRELFYKFSVPTGANVVFDADFKGNVRYVLYRDCTLEPVSCFFSGGDTRFLEPGTYLLAVEQEDTGPGASTDYRFTLGFNGDGGCLTPDLDGDGFTVCQNDCDEANSAVNPGASEGASCDHIDNDCNRMIDDLSATCPVPGQQGVCAEGALSCTPDGQLQCNAVHAPDPQGRDFCGDGLDNDCDGAADSADPQGCATTLSGDVCTLAEHVGAGGVFSGTLTGYGDDADLGCGDGRSGGPGAIERFYDIQLDTPRRLRAFVHVPGALGSGDPTGGQQAIVGGDEPAEGGGLALALLSQCGQFSHTCGGSSLDQEFPPGHYILAVTGDADMAYELSVATSEPDDLEGVTCSPPDLDGDGFNLCNGDCREDDPAVNRGASEACDGLDNDCDFFIDDGFFGNEACEVSGGQGECAFGHTACLSGELTCQAERQPGDVPEVCDNGLDDDCDGPGDDLGVPDVDCVLANAESCSLARPISPSEYLEDTLDDASDDGQGCFGGSAGDAEDKYYVFDAPSQGTLYVELKPLTSGAVPEHAIGVFGASCSNTSDLSCRGPGFGNYFIEQSGPHHIVVESDEPFAYELQVAFRSFESESCSVPDRDGDGFTLCDSDCDDSEPTRFFGASEICDGIDNDCDGAADNLGSPSCETGLFGVCAQGTMQCSGSEPTCVPDITPRANDVCSDNLDNDCDGQTDESGCDELPPGETCGLAIDVSSGGAFASSLSGASDDGENCGPIGSSDRYFRFSLEDNSFVYLSVVATFDPGGPEPLELTANLFRDCTAQQGFGCGDRFNGIFLGPGEYTLAVEANRAADFMLFIAFDHGVGCQAGEASGDFDGDGTTLCANDCNELDASVHPGAPELCNNFRDDDCDGIQDQVPFTACTASAPGECAAGRLECPISGTSPVCAPMLAPGSRPELCGDGLDNDCDGANDEPTCVEATGDSCELAVNLDLSPNGQIAGTITDPHDDVPGCGDQFFAEKVYRLTAPATGYMYVQAAPAAGFSGTFNILNAEGNCFGPGQCQGFGNDSGRPITAGTVYFLMVDGPPNVPFTLSWAIRPGSDPFFGSCFAGTSGQGTGDFDGDGAAMCDNDCDETDAEIHAGSAEVCGNQRDDNCDGRVDEQFEPCNTDLLGICAQGTLVCSVSGEPATCQPNAGPQSEFCNGLDDDCDGIIDNGTVCH
jgi:hypothetical protein